MNPISDIKRFLLRALGRAHGMPWHDALLDEAARQGILPRPLQSDIHQAKRELETAGYIQGARDEQDDLLTWMLTDKGQHQCVSWGEQPVCLLRKHRKSGGRTRPSTVPEQSHAQEVSSETAGRGTQQAILDQISSGAALCLEIERQLAGNPAPGLETLIKLYRVIILKLSVEANVAPGLLKLVNDLMKPVIDWERLEEKRKDREFAEQKHRDHVAQAAAEKAGPASEKALTPETLKKIEHELKLF